MFLAILLGQLESPCERCGRRRPRRFRLRALKDRMVFGKYPHEVGGVVVDVVLRVRLDSRPSRGHSLGLDKGRSTLRAPLIRSGSGRWPLGGRRLASPHRLALQTRNILTEVAGKKYLGRQDQSMPRNVARIRQNRLDTSFPALSRARADVRLALRAAVRTAIPRMLAVPRCEQRAVATATLWSSSDGPLHRPHTAMQD